jgi:glycosyltransferase involved in cell wall biosynthesis
MNRFSVIMTVYDQARELESQLPAMLTQDYEPGYEVIVVDESSTDDTEDVLALMKAGHPQLYKTFLPKPDPNIRRQRLALTIGVKAAKYEWIILTDIQSSPKSSEWLKEVAESLDSTTDMMLGYMRKKGLRLEAFEDISQGSRYIRKAERKRSANKRRRGKHLKYLRGKYDFIVVRKDEAHNLLKYFEHKIGWLQLMGLRMSIMSSHLF